MLYTGYILYPYKKYKGHLKWPNHDVFQGMIDSDKYSVEEIDLHAENYRDACMEVMMKLYEEYEQGAEAIYIEEHPPEVQIFKIG